VNVDRHAAAAAALFIHLTHSVLTSRGRPRLDEDDDWVDRWLC